MSTSDQKFTTSEVSIRQVAIEVQVLKIGNRQVTLSVFRQLQEENIIDFQTGALKGSPWGRVNYYPDNCRDSSRHMHVVWQKGNELRRSCVYDLSVLESGLRDNICDRVTKAYMAACAIERGCFGGEPWTAVIAGEEFRYSFPGWRIREDFETWLTERDFPVDAKVILTDHLYPAVQRYQQAKVILAQSYAQLEALDQLFIAV